MEETHVQGPCQKTQIVCRQLNDTNIKFSEYPVFKEGIEEFSIPPQYDNSGQKDITYGLSFQHLKATCLFKEFIASDQ